MNEPTAWTLYRPYVIRNPKLVTQQRLQYKIILKYDISIYLIAIIIISNTYIKIKFLWHVSKLP